MIELMIASAVSVVALIMILSLGFYTARSIASMTDSVDLNARSRYAIDRMSKKLRQATAMRSFSSRVVSVTYNGKPLTYTYQPVAKTIVENENGKTTTLLRNCDAMQFSYYKRNPVTNSFNQFPVMTSTNEAKVIQVWWQCHTTRIGKAGGSVEMAAAKIVVRSK